MKKRTVLALTLICLLSLVMLTGCKESKSAEKEVLVMNVDYLYYDSANELAEKADYIVRGKVTDKTYEWRIVSVPAAELYLNPEDVPPAEEDLVTVYTVQVQDSYLSTAEAGDTIEVLMMGGETDTAIHTFEGQPELYVDSEYVFFLSKSNLFENAGWPLNPAQSIYLAEGTSLSPVKGGFPLSFDWLEGLGDEVTAGETDAEESPLTLIANGESIFPYQHFAYSGGWDGIGFVCADGLPLVDELEGLVAEALIPCVNYSQDFNVILGESVTTRDILLFDEAFNQLDTLSDISDLSKLEAGIYYVGIVTVKEGQYIEEVDQHEYTGWTCVFQLNCSR